MKEAIAAVVDAIASTAQKYFFERFSEKEFDSIFDPLETIPHAVLNDISRSNVDI